MIKLGKPRKVTSDYSMIHSRTLEEGVIHVNGATVPYLVKGRDEPRFLVVKKEIKEQKQKEEIESVLRKEYGNLPVNFW